ncbi:MAG: response regulator [Clostridiales bacterium]|nr:response regulator [Clostridiales bacterium]
MIRVLLIDDDKLAREGLQSIVDWASCGMAVAGFAANGAKALEFLAEDAVDLAVVDLSMPVMDGLAFMKESKRLYPQLQYVVLSFHEEFENVQAALRFGAIDYISKMRLEQDDCTAVFKRVAGIITRDALTISSDSANEWEEYIRSALTFQWLYLSDGLRKLLDALLLFSLSTRRVEHFLVRLRETGEKRFNNDIPLVPILANIQQGCAWLGDLRSYLNHEAEMERASLNSFTNEMYILRAVLYMWEHLREALSLRDVANYINMSRSYFAANLKSVTGKTFNALLRYERVECAKSLLWKGMSPHLVASAVGYEDASYFSRIFVQHTGVTPIDYAKKR